jgi:hypothetical protein
MVLTFHDPMLIFLVERRVVGLVASRDFRISPPDVINLPDEDPSPSRLEAC